MKSKNKTKIKPMKINRSHQSNQYQEISDEEWLRQRFVRSMRILAPDRILQLIDECIGDRKELDERLKRGFLTPTEWSIKKDQLFYIYYQKLFLLNRIMPLNLETYKRVFKILQYYATGWGLLQ